MDPFSVDGDFWLPTKPERRVSGQLTLASDLTLTLYGSLREFPLLEGHVQASGNQTTEPVVHGQLRDGRATTLFNVSGLDLSSLSPFGRITETHEVAVALTNNHLDEDRFDQLCW